MATKLPRFRKGQVFMHQDANALAEAVERACNLTVDASSGLEMIDSPVGRTIRFVGDGTWVYVTLTTKLPAGDGVTSLGQGQCQVMPFTPGASSTAPGTLIVPPASTPTEPIENLLNGSIASGSTCLAARVNGVLQYVLTICSNGGS